MKKNKTLRLASALLIATLCSTCVISGTFAKYVSTSSGEDAARVAKWNITMNNTGVNTFEDSYEATVNTYNVGENLVAPGTNGSSEYKVIGAPETSYVVSFSHSDIKDVYLGEGTYTYADTAGLTNQNVNIDENGYYPIKYTVTVSTTAGTFGSAEGAITNSTAVTYNSLSAAMKALALTTVTFDAKETCDLKVTIAWKWAFDTTTGSHIVDANDTVLGYLAANEGVVTAADDVSYSTEVAYKLTVTVTQVD